MPKSSKDKLSSKKIPKSNSSSNITLDETFELDSPAPTNRSGINTMLVEAKLDALLSRIQGIENRLGKDEVQGKKEEIVPIPRMPESSLPDVKFDKPRNQHEYQFINALMMIAEDQERDAEDKLELIKDSLQARAVILITAQDEGWGVAAELDMFQTPKRLFMDSYAKVLEDARKRYNTKVKVIKPKPKPKENSRPIIIQTPTPGGDPNQGRTTKTGQPRGACYVCGELDHYANRCPKRPKGTFNSGGGGSSSRSN